MKSLLKNTFLYFNKIKVVHSIPGRLRLSIPGLNKIPNEFRNFEPKVTELIKLAGGIEEVNYSYITSKILFKYNPKLLSEEKILNLMNVIWKEILKREVFFKEEDIEENFSLIYEEIKSSLLQMKR